MTLENKLETTLAGLGYELVDLSFSVKSGLMRVFIDRPEGITLDDCVLVSNHLGHWLGVENIEYDRLEVSSPGLDRPVKKLQDFERFAGHKVNLRLRIARAGQRRFAGVIAGVDGASVLLDIEGQRVAFELDNVDQARLVPEV